MIEVDSDGVANFKAELEDLEAMKKAGAFSATVKVVPVQVQMASRRYDELGAALAVFNAQSKLADLYQEEIEEIGAFLAAYEAGELDV